MNLNNMDYKEIFKLIDKELNRDLPIPEINENNTVAKDSNELIATAIKQKKEIALEKKEHSGLITFHLNKIISYNDVLLKDGSYSKFKKEIKREYDKNCDDHKLNYFLCQDNIRIEIAFYVLSSGRDLDNILKPFIDTIFEIADSNDNKVYELSTRKIKHEESCFKSENYYREKIEFVISKMTTEEMETNKLIRKYGTEKNI